MNGGEERKGKHWDPRGASRPPPAELGGRRPDRSGVGRPRGARLPRPGCQRGLRLPRGLPSAFAGNFRRRISATLPAPHARRWSVRRVPIQPKPIGAEAWAELSVGAQFYSVAFKDAMSARAPTPRSVGACGEVTAPRPRAALACLWLWTRRAHRPPALSCPRQSFRAR